VVHKNTAIISKYDENVAMQRYSYSGRQSGNRTSSIKRSNHVISNDPEWLFNVITASHRYKTDRLDCISGRVCDSWRSCTT